MTARELVCLNLVVAVVAATTWFVQDLGDARQSPILNKPIFREPILQKAIENKKETTDMSIFSQSTPITDQAANFPEQQNINGLHLNTKKIDERAQTLDNLYETFRALETQYGVLSIDDIALLEESLNKIGQDDMLVDLSYALDELLAQP